MQEEDKRDYPEFLDKEVVYVDTSVAPVYQLMCRLVQCNYHIGLTLVESANPKHYVMCGLGPLAPKTRERYASDPSEERNWELEFEEAVSQINVGYFDVNKVANAAGAYEVMEDASEENCAFG